MQINLILAILGVVAAADQAYHGKVKILDSKNMQEEINKHEMLVVNFYAPWCEHCKVLAPIYNKIAKAFFEDSTREGGYNITFAKIDADKEKDMAEKYNISGFPTLMFFKGDQRFTHDGGLKKKSVTNWVTRIADLGSEEASCDFIELMREKKKFVFAYFGQEDTDLFKNTFVPTTETQDKMFSFHNNDTKCMEKLGVKENQIVLFRSFDDPKLVYNGE